MGQINWGIPYMGSKSKIAPEIIQFLPKGKRLVDLFGGGFAITECAMYSKKWDSYLYNDINPLITDLIKRAINGDFNYNKFKPEFITRENFFELKDKDGYVKYIWSFSNQGDSYLFGKPIEKIKEQGHNYCIFDKPIKGLDIPIIKGTPYQKRLYLKKWCALKLNKEWEKTILSDNKLICNSKEQLERLQQLERLEQLEQLERLQQLERLEQLEQLERLQQLERLEITTMSYEQYVYKDGDVVYCDIPYENTAEYDKENGFNHKAFYDWAISRPYKVYFSSYKISDNRFKKCFAIRKRSLMAGARSDNLYNYEMIYSN